MLLAHVHVSIRVIHRRLQQILHTPAFLHLVFFNRWSWLLNGRQRRPHLTLCEKTTR